MPEGIPAWLNPRIWIFVLAAGLLLVAAGIAWQAVSISPSPDGFTGPITHRAPTDAFESDPSSVAAIPDLEDKAQSGFQSAGMLRAGEAKTDSFPIEASVSTLFFLSRPYGKVELELISPSGHVYGPNSVPDSAWRYESTDQGLFGMGPGHTDYLTLMRAEPGIWKARVTARSVPDTMSQVPYLLGSMIETGAGVRVTNLTKNRTYHLGQSVPLVASVTEGGKGARGAQVTGYLPLDGDSARGTTVHLLDDGHAPDSSARDGRYSGLTPKLRKPGDIFYAIHASRKQAAGQPGFEHSTDGMLSVSRSRSHWTGRFRDYGVDTTKDGQFDELVVEAEIEVTDPCQVSGYAVLTTPSGGIQNAPFVRLRMTPGRHAIPLVFDGREVFGTGHGGPYTLSDIRLSEEDDEGQIALLDQLRNAYRTRAYDPHAFQHDPHRVVRVAGVHGLNQGPDGRYGALAVDIEVELDRQEYLQCQTWMEDDAHPFAINASTVATYPSGRQIVRMVFPGGCVHELGGNGHYRLRQFDLIGQWMNGPEQDLDLPVIDPNQYGGPHELRRPDGMILSSCGTKRP